MSASPNYSTRINQVSVDILEIEQTIRPLQAKLDLLSTELRRLKSKEFIRANNIKKEDVEMSDSAGLYRFTTCWGFATWLKKQQPVKRWAEWNGYIYHTTDLLNNKMPETPGMVCDL